MDYIKHPEKHQVRPPHWLFKAITYLPGHRIVQGNPYHPELGRPPKMSRKRSRADQGGYAEIAGDPATTAPVNAAHGDAVKAAHGKGHRARPLTIALSLNGKLGKVAKRRTTFSKQKPSKFASARFARKVAMQVLCPRMRLTMHTPTNGVAMTCGSGGQNIYNSTAIEYTFPSKQQLAQAAYKMSIDLAFHNRSAVFKANATGASGSNNWIPNMDATLIPGGSLQINAGSINLPATTASREVQFDEEYNKFPGIIMKYYKKIYTFFNTGTGAATLQVYEFIKADNNNNDSPLVCWGKGIKEDILNVGPLGGVHPIANYTRDAYTLGERPSKRNIELNSNWRTHKITSMVIQPGQSTTHVCQLPPTYYSNREIFQEDSITHVKNKCMSVMFILNGEIAYEGGLGTGAGAQGGAQGYLGTSTVNLLWRINAEAVFQSMPVGQKFATINCREDLLTVDEPNYTLQKPFTLIPTYMQLSKENQKSLDAAGEENDDVKD